MIQILLADRRLDRSAVVVDGVDGETEADSHQAEGDLAARRLEERAVGFGIARRSRGGLSARGRTPTGVLSRGPQRRFRFCSARRARDETQRENGSNAAHLRYP